jgi:opacity protein-like surface antigen
MKKSYLLALMALVSATAASAADKQDNQDKAAASDQKASKAEKPKKEKLICHSEPVTGSRTQVNRICHTAEEWDQIANQTRNNMDTLKESGSRGGEAAGTPGPG